MVKQSETRLDGIFHALADPTRRAIVRRLVQSECSIGELGAPFEMSFVAVSKHVKVLERAQLVKRRVRGRTHLCRLDARALAEAHRWLGAYERFWNESLDALEALIAERGGKVDGRD